MQVQFFRVFLVNLDKTLCLFVVKFFIKDVKFLTSNQYFIFLYYISFYNNQLINYLISHNSCARYLPQEQYTLKINQILIPTSHAFEIGGTTQYRDNQNQNNIRRFRKMGKGMIW
eukprot:TRINITY_DN2720_c0_g1_i5.p4 TRINITY_DN2720_c0_g1~~TRINITY_DN2720_c0_g1_i5.p4  ORF type:complete len:115 (-),score=1.99 TRINITY_DN2720_c0_g1_i5:179-523(-)